MTPLQITNFAIFFPVSCTDNGDCIHKGPGYAKCVCKPGHYGYKCMNEVSILSILFVKNS